MANLKPFTIEIVYLDDSKDPIVVLAYSAVHAIYLVYRYLESIGMLNRAHHGAVIEHVRYISPNTFKDGQN